MQKSTITTVLATAERRLAAAQCNTPRLDAELLLVHTLNKTRTWLYTYPNTELTPEQAQAFFENITRRQQRQPVAYITGHKAFFGLEFDVTADVLIPRPETELLVETAIRLAARCAQPVIADVGTGSGCIAVALAAQLPQARLLAIDISEPALTVARQNARRHNVANRITFLTGDLLAPLAQPVDFIVSNPPYVSQPELQQTDPEVQQFEPRLALDGGATGLRIIERLLAESPKKLKMGGALLVEIGFAQGPAVKIMARQHFPQATIHIRQDLAGLDRLLTVNGIQGLV